MTNMQWLQKMSSKQKVIVPNDKKCWFQSWEKVKKIHIEHSLSYRYFIEVINISKWTQAWRVRFWWISTTTNMPTCMEKKIIFYGSIETKIKNQLHHWVWFHCLFFKLSVNRNSYLHIAWHWLLIINLHISWNLLDIIFADFDIFNLPMTALTRGEMMSSKFCLDPFEERWPKLLNAIMWKYKLHNLVFMYCQIYCSWNVIKNCLEINAKIYTHTNLITSVHPFRQRNEKAVDR